MKLPVLLITLTVIATPSFSQNAADTTQTGHRGLIGETMLHPGDAFTAYTFNKGEWSVNKAVDLLPIPNWIYWGITDWLTAELDIEANLGGVPSVNLRFALAQQKGLRPALAYEVMYQHIFNRFDLFGGGIAQQVIRGGNHTFNHLNASWKLAGRWHLHLSAGATYTEYLQIADTVRGESKEYNDLIAPDFSAGIDWRAKDWISLHGTASYGSTFAYLDNVPLKQQFTFAIRLAPFVHNKRGFFRAFRMDMAIASFYFADAGTRITGPVGYIYWQWTRDKKKKKQ